MLEAAIRAEIESEEAEAFALIKHRFVNAREIAAAVAHQLELTEVLESQVRAVVEHDRGEQMVRFAAVETRERAAVSEQVRVNFDQLQKWHRQQKAGGIKDFWAVAGRRAGVLSLSVVRARGLVPRKRNMYSCDTRVVVTNPNSGARYVGPIVYNSVDPEWDFEAYLTLSDDRAPVVIAVEGILPGVGVSNVLAVVRLDLRRQYPNLVRSVTAEEVYMEKGHVEMDATDKDGAVFPSTTVTLKWSLESRTMESEAFCEDCGSLEHRCRCAPEAVAARRVRQYEALVAEQRRVETARRQREEREEAEAAAARAEQERAILAVVRDMADELEFEEGEARRRVAHAEATAHLFLLDTALNGATRKLALQWTVEVAVLAAALLAEGSCGGDEEHAVRMHSLSLWRLNTRRAKLRRHHVALLRSLNETKATTVRDLNTAKRDGEEAKKRRDEARRKKEEMAAFDVGKDDLNGVTVDHDGIPRAVRMHDTSNAPRAQLPAHSTCCCAIS